MPNSVAINEWCSLWGWHCS